MATKKRVCVQCNRQYTNEYNHRGRLRCSECSADPKCTQCRNDQLGTGVVCYVCKAQLVKVPCQSCHERVVQPDSDSCRVCLHSKMRTGGKTDRGYVRVSYNGKKRMQHVVVMEQHIGRSLVEGETVHHKNGVRHDNRIENLELWRSAHHPGQRVSDLIAWAVELLKLYKPSALAPRERG